MSVFRTIARNLRPILVMFFPLVLITVGQLADVLMRMPDTPPKDVNGAIWALYRHAIGNLAWTSSALVFGLAGVILTIFDHNDKVTDALTQISAHFQSMGPASIRKLPNDREALDEMAFRIGAAKKHIYLMYLRSEPATDEHTRQYWDKMTDSLVGITSALPVRRVASIDTLKKLEYLLENNKVLFDKGRVDLGRLDYKLVVYPSVALKPLQWDIVDDALFLFTPYTNKQMLLVTDKEIIDNYATQFTAMLERIRDYTIISTSGKAPALGKQTCGYSAEELRNILRTMRFILRLDASSLPHLFKKHIKDYCEDLACDENWFVAEYGSVRQWADLVVARPHAA